MTAADIIARLATIHDCANKTLGEMPMFPCRMDEMTPRELAIAGIVSSCVGALKFIEELADDTLHDRPRNH